MKKLSIEEKAKAYDEALKQIKECTPDENGFITIYPQEIFPELRETEGERIRKWLIDYLNNRVLNLPPGAEKEAVSKSIPWLEKQDEQKKTLCDKCKKAQPSHSCQDITALGRCTLEKQGEQKYTQRDIENAYLKGIADVKREVKKIDEQTEKMKKEIAEFIFNSKEDIKQRHEWIKCLGFDVKFSNEEKQDEQKSAPKYKIGDTIYFNSFGKVQSMIVANIVDNGDNNPMYEDADGSSIFENDIIDQKSAKWDILSAKKGDVLSNGTIVLIVNSIEEFEGKPIINSWYFADSEKFYGKGTSECDRWEVDGFRTATEAECNYLLKMMADTGYEWNAEKKELKKIEQKPVEYKEIPTDIRSIVDKEANSIWKEINTGHNHSIIDTFNQFYGICMQVAEAVMECNKPAEWSEEDELHIRELEGLVKQVWATAERENDKDTIHKMSDLSFFLKTLKPQ